MQAWWRSHAGINPNTMCTLSCPYWRQAATPAGHAQVYWASDVRARRAWRRAVTGQVLGAPRGADAPVRGAWLPEGCVLAWRAFPGAVASWAVQQRRRDRRRASEAAPTEYARLTGLGGGAGWAFLHAVVVAQSACRAWLARRPAARRAAAGESESGGAGGADGGGGGGRAEAVAAAAVAAAASPRVTVPAAVGCGGGRAVSAAVAAAAAAAAAAGAAVAAVAVVAGATAVAAAVAAAAAAEAATGHDG